MADEAANYHCPVCRRGDVRTDDCITLSEGIPGSDDTVGVFAFKIHRWCVFDVLTTGGNLADYSPEPV